MENIIKKLKEERDRFSKAIEALEGLVSKRQPSNVKKKGKRTMSASARKAIGDAQRKRWKLQKAKKG